jgi:maleate isomerase
MMKDLDMPTLPRLGVLIPSTDTTVEKELPVLVAGLATCHFTRMRLAAVTHEGLRAMESDALAAAGVLADARPDLVVFGCTSGSFIFGADYETDLARKLSDIVGVPVIMTAQAMATTLRSHGTTVRLRTPYEAAITADEVTYLEAAGMTVSSSMSLGITIDDDIAAVSGDQLMGFVQGSDEPDVVMLSCTNLQTLHLLSDLAAVAHAPVVTSNLSAATVVKATLAS